MVNLNDCLLILSHWFIVTFDLNLTLIIELDSYGLYWEF